MPAFQNDINTTVPALQAINNSQGFNIYISQLNQDVGAFLGVIDASQVQLGVTASAELVAFTDISAEVFRNLLIMTVDSDDISGDDVADGTDISFVAPKSINLSALNTQCGDFETAFVSKHLHSGAIGGVADTTAGEDFTRYLSAKLFNTYQAVDLFSNERVIADSVKVNAGELYTKLQANAVDIAEKIYNHIRSQDTNNERIYDLSGTWDEASGNSLTDAVLDSTAVVGKVPIRAGDQIIFNVSVRPDSTQNDLTDVPSFYDRVYRVVLNLT